ncbi:MAG: murein biosynthesis integral membrane protein MurJ [Candidatus Roizmanbacteria bacterium]
MQLLINRTKQFIFAQQTSMFSSTIIIASMLIVARIFGFWRYRVLAGFFTTAELDIFFASFRWPDLIFEILITGALTSSFIPYFIKYEKDKKNQSINVSTIINVVILVLLALICMLVAIMPLIMNIITPGYTEEKIRIITFYSQVLLLGQLPYLVFGNFLTGISQARKSFLLPAIAPVIYNLGIILMTYLGAGQLHMLAPILGVVIGAFAFFLIQIPILFNSDFLYIFTIRKSKEIWEFFKVAIPRIFTVVVAQIDATIDLSLTTLLGGGSYTIFYLAQHLQLLPVSILGMAFGQASLPYLTEVYQHKHKDEFKKIIADSLLNVMFLVLPISAYLIFARTPIVRFFYGGEKFDWESTNLTALTLSYFALSLPFHSIYYFITRCFYAMFDSRTPFFASFISIGINGILSLIFVLLLRLPVWSLAVAFSISITVNVIILFIILHFKLKFFDLRYMGEELTKMLIATGISVLVNSALLRLLDGLILDTTRTINVFFLLIITSLSFLLLYLFISWLLNVKELYLITKMTLKFKEYQRKIIEIYTGVQ